MPTPSSLFPDTCNNIQEPPVPSRAAGTLPFVGSICLIASCCTSPFVMTEHSGAANHHIVHQHRPTFSDPHSYPSPSLQNSYTYPPQGQQPGQSSDYRTPSTTTTSSSMAQHPVNLPPIRTFDGQTQPSAQQPSSGYVAPSTLPQPGPPINSYYQHPYLPPPPPGPQPSSLAAQAAQMGMRYPMPPHLDQRTMSGGRHKKEIKRRTKTGCLTCRKRRIKVS